MKKVDEITIQVKKYYLAIYYYQINLSISSNLRENRPTSPLDLCSPPPLVYWQEQYQELGWGSSRQLQVQVLKVYPEILRSQDLLYLDQDPGQQVSKVSSPVSFSAREVQISQLLQPEIQTKSWSDLHHNDQFIL